MSLQIKWAENAYKKSHKNWENKVLSEETNKEVMAFHKSFDEYHKTPFENLEHLAKKLGLKAVYVKDESYRFGLNAFKVLGASYAIGKTLADYLEKDIQDTPFAYLKSDAVKQKIKGVKLVATTDGNHGRGVAWTGNQLDLDVEIYMPKGSTQNRLDHILKLGANGQITPYNYDDTVRYMIDKNKDDKGKIIQDTAWEGYTDVPVWIMQGYATVAVEMIEDLGDQVPTHVFLQAGVGAFAGVIAEAFVMTYKEKAPRIIVVEADAASCLYESVQAGQIRNVAGDLNTIMAGLACGEPNPIAWDILKESTDVFIAASDEVTAKGMRILGSPLAGDKRIISGESGAVTTGVLSVIAADESYKDLKERLEINEASVVILVSTEGNTDPQIYQDIVWDGKYPSYQ
ncbi:diaminopropionate ammonia-lyase [Cellulosilyticum sp. I15G10I2]|uniref:diaminopropionate ammonia-lyase n=1 Tax=Cellulosilyticum sp. I15G10I2 TaxID=1892843 RepID=UPI00085C04FC|nr:diaminopropionate ammonia-lyase [Cellulosilyticum sp. I15G10I2]